jgi:thiamine biosynthesis lipoprotein
VTVTGADPRLERFEDRAMGSALRLTVHGAAPGSAARAWDAVRRDVEHTEECLSRWRASSDLSRLNAGPVEAWLDGDPRLATMLTLARRAQRQTQGRFDARVLRALEEIGEHAGVPVRSDPDPDGGGIGWLHRDGRNSRVRVAAPVDSGGIGKGLALRWALRAARRAAPGSHGLFLEAGGDIGVDGAGPENGAWSIGVEDPTGSGDPLAVIVCRGGGIATSSTAVRHWIAPDGAAVHHLLDPRTGRPADGGLLAVTVAHLDPAWAEVWSKALFIGGRDAIGPEARARGMAAWWVEDDGSLHLTPAARAQTAWTQAQTAAS